MPFAPRRRRRREPEELALVDAQHPRQPRDGAAGADQIHLQAPPVAQRERRHQVSVRGVERQIGGHAHDHGARSPQRDPTGGAGPERATHRVGRAQDHGHPGRQPQSPSPVRVEPARERRRLHPRELRRISAGKRFVPSARPQGVAPEPGRRARIGGRLTGQPEEDVILRAEDPGRARGERRFLMGDPSPQRDQVAPVHPLAGLSIQRILARAGAEPFTVGVGTIVLPRDRGPDGHAVAVRRHQRREHRRQSDARPTLRRRRLRQRGDDLDDRGEPIGRILLRASG